MNHTGFTRMMAGLLSHYRLTEETAARLLKNILHRLKIGASGNWE